MMHGQKNIKLLCIILKKLLDFRFSQRCFWKLK